MPYFGIPIRNGLPIGLGSVAGFGVQQFSPADLFSAGEQGAWYDPSDFSTLFDDSAGITPVTAVEQFVGLMLDKSKGLVLGPELVTNPGGPYTTTTGYTATNGSLSVDGVNLRFTETSGISRFSFTWTAVIGKTYLVKIRARSSSAVARFFGSSDLSPSTDTAIGSINATFKTFEFRVTATSTAPIIRAYISTSSTSGSDTIDYEFVNVAELPGNHAFQTSSAKRPKLAARYNLLTYTEEFDNAAWIKSNLNTTGTPAWVNVAVAPDGTTTADKFIANVGTFRVDAANTTPVVVAQYSQTIYAQKDTYQYLWIGDRGDAAGIRSATFDLNSGTVLGQSNGTASIFDAGNGWWKCVLLYSRANAGNASAMYALGDSSHTIDRPSKTWLGTEALNVWGADLRPASQATGLIGPTYQRVVDAATYDAVGFLPYLEFNGLSWSMSTNSIDFSAGDKVTVWAGVRKLSDPALGIITELGPVVDTNNGSFAVGASIAAAQRYVSALRGTALAYYEPATYAAPVTNVLATSFNIAGAAISDEISPRVNGILEQDNPSGANAGTGNFGNYPLFIGARNNASAFFQGWMYSLTVRGAQSSASEISAMESWVAGKTGVSL